MMNRWYILAVLACWLASMGWLVVEKVLPTLREGERPTYADVLPKPAAPPRRVCWKIEYGGADIGSARSLSTRAIDGSGRIESTVRFDDLPLSEIMSELLGTVGALVKPLWNVGDNVRIAMTITSEMDIDAEGKLRSFTTDVRIDELSTIIRVDGEVDGATLHMAVFTADHDGKMRVRLREDLDLPSEAMVSGAFSPQDRFAQLHVGQTWTLPVYRPFPPNSPVQMLQAKVEGKEIFIWNHRSLSAYHVVYRDDAGSGITITREPIGKMWVSEDGVVLQQDARIANLHFRFIRLPDEDCGPPQE